MLITAHQGACRRHFIRGNIYHARTRQSESPSEITAGSPFYSSSEIHWKSDNPLDNTTDK